MEKPLEYILKLIGKNTSVEITLANKTIVALVMDKSLILEARMRIGWKKIENVDKFLEEMFSDNKQKLKVGRLS